MQQNEFFLEKTESVPQTNFEFLQSFDLDCCYYCLTVTSHFPAVRCQRDQAIQTEPTQYALVGGKPYLKLDKGGGQGKTEPKYMGEGGRPI